MTTPDDFEPFSPRERDPSRETCPFCTRLWRACVCGETQGDVLDLEHALSEGARIERSETRG